MQKILTPREKIILYITVGMIIFAFVFNFFIAPVLNRLEDLNKEINITQIKLKKYILLSQQKDYIQSRFNKFASGRVLSDVGTYKSITSLQALETLAKDAGIRIIDIRPQTSSGPDLYKEIRIDLRTEGDMEGYLKFIYNIENSLSLLQIKKFQLSAKPNTQTLEGNFSILQVSTTE